LLLFELFFKLLLENGFPLVAKEAEDTRWLYAEKITPP
jgi:hypothetical protein